MTARGGEPVEGNGMQVLAVQLDIVWQDTAANHTKVQQLLDGISVQPDTLIVLPEMFDTGFSMRIEATAQSDARGSEAFLRQLARDKQCGVLAGVTGPIEDGKASNEAVLFDADGELRMRYRKMKPFSPAGEHQKYHAGETHRLFDWQGLRGSCFVCYDLRFPELFRPAVRDGAELIIVIASWPDARSEHWVRLLQARAIENLAYVIGVNRCGADPQLNYDGRSVAFDPHGKCLAEADAREQVLSLDIDPEEVRRWRAKFPVLQDM
ncbi:MAG: nitrilase-related carbon-nitrogen hydrolase [Planctomycetota bacterium]